MVDPDTHKAMLSFYHKKEKEMKELENADEGDHHMNSQWANSGNLKAQLHGSTDIKWKFGGGMK
jgi:cilia- and flagella-associated protein 298